MAFKVTKLPWKFMRRSLYTIRRAVGGVRRPDEKHLVVESDIETLEDAFRKLHFREGWFLSYYYRGEDSNLCRAEYKEDEFEDYQLHIRLFERSDGRVEIYSHVELDPMQYPRKHISEVNISTEEGVEMTKGILKQNKIEFVEA